MVKVPGRIDEICDKLSEEFRRSVPLQTDRGKRGKRLSESEIKASSELALKKFYETAYQERQSHGLGVIGRARVAFGLQQRLLQAGYPPPLVKQVLFALLATVFVGGKR
ncbi:hypothetical protein [Herbaspirillum sp. ST 5-3]|uniref:hypothetical protein n=1 Tax=Oxalobacteraceae TaxID=75682 RepID=UPI0010A4B260|nr:hypothetical protein [Herbaspirillum sp. ST 5-3]